ncbi:MAG TPA: hypothetical protein VHL53_17505 [Acidimicrobiia bacterium]|nr:hypothetical protein [Acidimicrobiia bacterium]
MMQTLRRSAASGPAGGTADERMTDAAYQSRIDVYILVGAILMGSMVLAAPGLVVMAYAWKLHRAGVADGRRLRPVIISIVAVTCLVDAAVNFLIWSADLLPVHDTVLGHTLYTGFGRLYDGAYYLGYNTTALGGTAIPSEKGLEFAGCLLLYPMRLVAAWGFMRMKKWGFQYLVVNTWMYVFFWMTYIGAFSMEFQWRFPFTVGGVALLWGLYIWFIYPFFMIPYLATVNRDLWTD